MTPAQLQKVEETFHAALDCDPAQLQSFLDRACAGDAFLREKVNALLRSYEQSTDFIEAPPSALAARILQSESERADSLIGRTIGHYKILEHIGTGGMGEVYLAGDMRADRKAALKLLPPDFTGDAERLKRFQQEARAVVALNHPNILTVYEIGQEESTYYIVSERIEGETLRQRLSRSRLELKEAIDVAIQVASALAAAHEAGIVHRDIKPENIMLRRDGYVKVLDFGIAKLAESKLPDRIGKQQAIDIVATNTGSILGTVRYMSPEQARGESVDERSDIWSLGIVLYEMLTGSVPFAGDTPKQVINSILSSEPAPMSKAPVELQKIVNTALRKDRQERFHNIGEMLEALKNFRRQLEFVDELARAPVWLRWTRKPAAVVTALILVSLLLIALGVLIPRIFVTQRTQPATATALVEKSIAVLPFQNLSSDEDKTFFADGVQDEILTDLSWIADLKVISRTSVMQYKAGLPRNLLEIARQLGVTHVLEGSVQHAANRVRINVQLIVARYDGHPWAETYDREVTDIFAVQSEIAKTIADQLHAKLSLEEKAAIDIPPTKDVLAFDLYTRAKALANTASYSGLVKEKLLQAIELFNQAIARDPQFVRAYCEVASAHDLLYFYNLDRTSSRLGLGDAAVQTALRLRPDSGEAHLAAGGHLYRGYLDYDRARDELAIARRTLPNEPSVFAFLSFIDRRQGRWEDSARNLERALELDPRNLALLQQAAATYQSLRRFREKAAVLDRALTIAPSDVDMRVTRALIDLDWRADPRPLRKTIDAILAQDPKAAAKFADIWFLLAVCERDVIAAERALTVLASAGLDYDAIRLTAPFGRALVARMRGDHVAVRAAFTEARAEQEKVVEADPQYGPAQCVLGLIDAGLGRKEDALAEGRRAMELLPVEKDSINGIRMIEYFAVIAAWTGNKDLALQTLARAVKVPGRITYGKLRLHPFWDPLRGDTRFEKIVASLAPKD